jgi:hypothetical protein
VPVETVFLKKMQAESSSTSILLEVTSMYDLYTQGDIKQLVSQLDDNVEYKLFNHKSVQQASAVGRMALQSLLRKKRDAIELSQWVPNELKAHGTTVNSSGIYRGLKNQVPILGEWSHELHVNAQGKIYKFVEKLYELEEKYFD